jgi:hypothetical protein
MIIKANNNEYRVWWHHIPGPTGNITICMLSTNGKIDNENFLSSYSDVTMNKKLGRKSSFTRLVSIFDKLQKDKAKDSPNYTYESKTTRILFWKAYWDRFPEHKRPIQWRNQK